MRRCLYSVHFLLQSLVIRHSLLPSHLEQTEGLSAAVVVWLACSLGLFAADVIGLLIGYLLKSKAPEGILNTVAFFIFSIFGILTLRQGFGLLMGAESSMVLPLTAVVTVAFVIVCLVLYRKSKAVHTQK